jgi:antitoxin component of MazEF toxin-antitoxin module
MNDEGIKTKIAKYGGSYHIRIPAAIMQLINFDIEKEYRVEFSIDADVGAAVVKIFLSD